jgi:hypothetical protein
MLDRPQILVFCFAALVALQAARLVIASWAFAKSRERPPFWTWFVPYAHVAELIPDQPWAQRWCARLDYLSALPVAGMIAASLT